MGTLCGISDILLKSWLIVLAIVVGVAIIIFLISAIVDFVVERMLMGKFSSSYCNVIKNKIKRIFSIDIEL